MFLIYLIMKKRILFAVMMLFTWMTTTWADGVKFEYDAHNYPTQTVIYLALTNSTGDYLDVDESDYYVGAFIDGVCRGEATPQTVMGSTGPIGHVFALTVGGDESEIGQKVITFKVCKVLAGSLEGDTYTIPSSTNVAFNGDATVGEPSDPYKIAFVPVTSISLPDEITVHRGTTIDMSEKLTCEPENGLLPELIWDDTMSAGMFSMTGNMLTALAAGPDPRPLTVTAGQLMANTNIFIDAPATAYAWNEAYSSGVTVNVDDYETLTSILTTGYTLTPADATTTFTWTSSDESVVAYMPTNSAWNPINKGTVTMTGTANDDSGLTMTLKVTVIQPITGFMFSSAPVVVQVGDDVTARVKAAITVLPDGASNPKYSLQIGAENTTLQDDNGTITAIADWDYTDNTQKSKQTVIVRSLDGSNIQASLTVYVIPKQPTNLSAKAATVYLTAPTGGAQKDCTTDLLGNLTLTPNTLVLNDFDPMLTIANTSVIDYGDGENYVIVAAGTTTIDASVTYFNNLSATINSVNGMIDIPTANLNTQFTVVVQEGLGSFTFDNVQMVRGDEYALTLKATPEGATYDASLVTVVVTPNLSNANQADLPGGWTYVDAAKTGDLKYTLTANSVGNGFITIYYSGEEKGSGTIEVSQKQTAAAGWQWMSLYQASVNGKAAIKNIYGDNLEELRSDEQLLYNDSQVGYFGTLTTLEPMKTYKLKLKSAQAYDLPNHAAYDYFATAGSSSSQSVSAVKGWNWLGTPYQYYQPVAIALAGTTFSEGDYIKGKTSFTQYTNGQWVGTLKYFTPGEGYLIKFNNAGTLNYAPEFTLDQNLSVPSAARSTTQQPRLYTIDDTRYADNMAMVAYVNAVTDPARCTLYAFVDGECRGYSQTIGDRQFIVVHGTPGEKVRFRVYDEVNGMLHEVNGLRTLEPVSGTFKQPVSLRAGAVTAIDDVITESAGNNAVYDLQGRSVNNTPAKGLYIKDGRKYIVK